MPTGSATKIVISKDGPYRVLGNVPAAVQTIVPNIEGLSWDREEGGFFPASKEIHLCRWRRSANKPFCDGSHASIKYQDGLRTR